MVPAGSYFGEGLLLVPDKLVKEIIKFEFVEMYELLPETWWRDEDEDGKGLAGLHRKKSAPVTNILRWVQYLAAMVGTLARAYPQMVPDMMAYQATFVRCYHNFEDLHLEMGSACREKGHLQFIQCGGGVKVYVQSLQIQHACSECRRGKHPRAMCPSEASSEGSKGITVQATKAGMRQLLGG
jgi:hypothetical protein